MFHINALLPRFQDWLPCGRRAVRAVRPEQASVTGPCVISGLRWDAPAPPTGSDPETDIGSDGYALGGLAVGEGQEAMFACLDFAPDQLPVHKPRYLMGVGKPDDIVGAVKRGIDMMDCVLPSRSGRTGQAFTRRGVINIKNGRHAEDLGPLDEACTCPACRSDSRAYLHHVFRAQEMIFGHAADLAQPALL